MDRVKGRAGRRSGTDQPRSVRVAIRVTEREQEAIYQCFRTTTELRKFLLEIARKKEVMLYNKRWGYKNG